MFLKFVFEICVFEIVNVVEEFENLEEPASVAVPKPACKPVRAVPKQSQHGRSPG